jgi:outer membrane biosynthesis protein TonB
MSYDISEIEKRLKMAGAYRSVLDQKILSGTDEQISNAIEDELKDFVKGRLEVLLGVRATPEAAAHFTTTEVLVLKSFAKKVLSSKDEPEDAPDQEQEEEVVVKPPKRAAQPKPQPKTKSVPKPTKTVPKQAALPPQEVPESEREVKDSIEFAEVGDIVVENGRRYEIIELNGKLFPKDITKQAVSSERLPMPPLQSGLQQLAYNSLAAASDPITQALIQASMGG